jgi:hypothetical protein
MRLGTKIYWLTDRQSQCDFDFEESSPIQNLDLIYMTFINLAADHGGRAV